MHDLHSRISDGLWQALEARAKASGDPIRHIVAAALAEHLGTEHRTLFQVSTSTALVEGVYQGAVRVGTLREHGNLGLGTFENLDGEMAIVDGNCFQIRGDGSVHKVGDDVLSPFAVVTRFAADETATLAACADLHAMVAASDRLRHSQNVFYALRVTGTFDHIKTRAMCKTTEGTPLAEAAAVQPEFEFTRIAGTLVGFWTPEYAKSLNVPGYHFHFLSADHRHGGHLLECSGRGLTLEVQREAALHFALPETVDFLKADLSRDPTKALDFAENTHKGRAP
jgi:acetolactate decarboxylase